MHEPRVTNRIGLGGRAARRVPASRKVGLVIHRCGLGSLDEAAAGYRELGWRSFPYHLWVEGCDVYQVHPIASAPGHARHHNARRIGVAVVGDWRATPVVPETWDIASVLTAILCARFGWDPYAVVGPPRFAAHAVAGHHELPWGSTDVDPATGKVTKDCPGRKWVMPGFRMAVKNRMLRWRHYSQREIAQAFEASGLVI